MSIYHSLYTISNYEYRISNDQKSHSTPFEWFFIRAELNADYTARPERLCCEVTENILLGG